MGSKADVLGAILVCLDRCTCSYTLDRTHHLLSTIRMWDGARFPVLLQLPHRRLPVTCSIGVGRQLGPPIPVRCRVPIVCHTHVCQSRCQLGLYSHRLSGSSLRPAPSVSFDRCLVMSCS